MRRTQTLKSRFHQYEADKRVIDYMGPTVEEEPRLLDFFAKYKTRVAEEQTRAAL